MKKAVFSVMQRDPRHRIGDCNDDINANHSDKEPSSQIEKLQGWAEKNDILLPIDLNANQTNNCKCKKTNDDDILMPIEYKR